MIHWLIALTVLKVLFQDIAWVEFACQAGTVAPTKFRPVYHVSQFTTLDHTMTALLIRPCRRASKFQTAQPDALFVVFLGIKLVLWLCKKIDHQFLSTLIGASYRAGIMETKHRWEKSQCTRREVWLLDSRLHWMANFSTGSDMHSYKHLKIGWWQLEEKKVLSKITFYWRTKSWLWGVTTFISGFGLILCGLELVTTSAWSVFLGQESYLNI